MKKRLLSLLLILCLCAALLPVAVFAEGNVIELTDNYINEKLIKESEVADGKTIYHYRNALPAGSYRLTEDITLYNEIRIEGSVTIDLNGKTIKRHSGENEHSHGAFSVQSGGHLTLTDSSNENGTISDFDGSVHVLAGGTFTMNGGRLQGGAARGSGCRAQGGGVLVDEGGLFVMNGGSIENCYANGDGGGVYVNGTFRMTGGTIRNCEASEAAYQGTHGYGGGVFIAPNGTFEMSGGSIENCKAVGRWQDGKGGGVYVGGTFNMTGGEIKNCTAVGNGGGVYVDDFEKAAFNMTGGTITGCTANEGSGVYVADGATATLITANITGNTKTGGEEDNITAPGGYKEYEPPVDPVDPDYPLISILPALAKDLLFTDVTSTDWFYSDVKYAYETGLMTGTSGTAFSPEAPVTRGMVMTILARREGIRTDRYTPWYAAGCEWAKANGISDGSNPEAPVIREQLAAMLYRYAALKGRDLTAGENLNFTDASDVSAYALPALQWATGEKILTGSNGALNPQAPAARAHLAAILHRYFG